MRKKLSEKICIIVALLFVLTSVPTFADSDDSAAEVKNAVQMKSAAGKQIVYTEKTKPNLDTSGDGSRNNPYNRFEDALANVADGGTIYIIGSGAFINVQDEGGIKPYIIDKNVKICAEGSGQANLSVRSAGLIMNGDVTFENIELGFANKYHSAIFANGHNLTLKNVGRTSGTRLVHIFAGGIQIGNGIWLGAAPKAGGSVTVSGEKTHLGNIYAGGMNAVHTGDVSVSVVGANNMIVGGVYACGAYEPYINLNDWFDMSEPPEPEYDAENLIISGAAEITLNNTPVRTVVGFGPQSGTTLNFSTQYANPYISMIGIKNLNVREGILEPFILTSSNPGEGFGMIAVEPGAVLNITGNDEPVKTEIFKGGGTLVLGRNEEFTVTKELTGSTAFETNGGTGGKSGLVIGGHPYINAPSNSTGTFTFTPDFSQDGSVIKSEISGEKKVWSIELAEDSASVINNMSCAKPEMTIYKNEIEDYKAEFAVIIEKDSLRFPSFEYKVKFNGENYEVNKSDDGNESVNVKPLNLEIFVTSDSSTADNEYALCVYPMLESPDAAEIRSGFYEITIIADSVNGQIPLTVYLTVLPDLAEPDAAKKDSTVSLDTVEADDLVFGESAEFRASVSDENGTVESAEIKYYVNGVLVGEAEAGGAGCSAEISTVNGFIVGNNTVIAVFEGSDTHNAAVSDSIAVKVNKTAPDIYVKLNGGITFVYDGQAHVVSGDLISVMVPGAQDTEVPYSVTYTDETGSHTDGAPVTPGKYSVCIKADETGYSIPGELTEHNAVIIEKAKPEIVLAQQKDGSGNTQIVVTVNGVGGGINPAGEVTLLRDGTAVGGAEPLRFGQAVFSLGKWTGTAVFSAEYNTEKVEKPCYSDAVSKNVSMTVTENSSGSGSGSGGAGGGSSSGGSGGSGGASSGTQTDVSESTDNVTGTAVKPASELFTDVKAGTWYEEAVSFAVNRALFKGISENKFDPSGKTSRAMVITVLARMNGQNVDGASPWYVKSVQWAVGTGISDGSRLDENITREQLVTMLYRYADYSDAQIKTGESGVNSRNTDLTVFTDGSEVSSWAEEAMKWAVAGGIIEGDSRMCITPSASATRAETAVILERFVKITEEN